MQELINSTSDVNPLPGECGVFVVKRSMRADRKAEKDAAIAQSKRKLDAVPIQMREIHIREFASPLQKLWIASQLRQPECCLKVTKSGWKSFAELRRVSVPQSADSMEKFTVVRDDEPPLSCREAFRCVE